MSQTAAEPRYPDLEVSLHSDNPLALIAAVRQALRQARVERQLIGEFSDAAFHHANPEERRRVCRRWVSVVS